MPIVDPNSGQPLTSPDSAKANAAAPADVIVDIDMTNFQQVVLEGSMQIPVLLDCWAPWCEPCKNLMPILEKLAVEYNGTFILAKLNIEEHQQIAAQLGIRSVPDVKLIMQGQLYDEFQGALPEKQIREWLAKYIQPPEDAPQSPEEQAQAALDAGDPATARGIFEQLAQAHPDHVDYRIDLAGALLAEGNPDRARAILDGLAPEDRDAPRRAACGRAWSSARRRPAMRRWQRSRAATTARHSTCVRCGGSPTATTRPASANCSR